jgi:tetratricopeptide (TPR) repeat protein
MRLGELHIEKGQLDRAKRHLEAALALMPEAEDVIAANGRLRELLGDAPGAIDHYRRALAKNPLRYEALYRMAMLLSRSTDEAEQKEGAELMARHSKAEPFLIDIERTQRELEINRGNALLLTQLAGLLNLAGEYQLARQWGEQSFRINRSSPSTCIQLAYISANLGDNATALKYFERAQTLLPKGSVKTLDEYVEKLRKGEALKLPMGEIYRPQQGRKAEGDRGDPEAPAPPAGGGAQGD